MEKNLQNTMVNEEKASEILGISVYTLRNRRAARRPPNFFKLGGLVKYRISDLEDFLESCLVKTAEQKKDLVTDSCI